MPKKTKEAIEENNKKIKSNSTTTKKTTKTAVKVKEEKTVSKSKTTKKASVKKEPKSKTEKNTKKAVEDKSKKAKNTVSKVEKKPSKKNTSKKSTSSIKKATKKTSTKSTSKSKATKLLKTKEISLSNVEYYDLPYKYNQTVVKVLYQNPTTLFVYWEISDNDIENYKNVYGEDFFEITRPVLVIYNETMNYKFEIDINDFANCWYFNINDSKCNYRVELIRKPIYHNEKIKTEYIHISSSNKIESPNDRILFSTNEPYTVYFKNTKNNNQRKVNLPKLLKKLNISNNTLYFPIIQNVYDLYKNIYHIEEMEDYSISLTNPSSSNPSSHSLRSRFF